MTKLVLLLVAVIAAVATADALRDSSRESVPRTAERQAPTAPAQRFTPGAPSGFFGNGHYLHTQVLSEGRVHLSEDAVAEAFPAPVEGPIDISKVALAPDGTLVLAVYRFPAVSDARAGLELWRGRELVGAFTVPPGSFAGGIAFNRDGSLVATFSRDGELRGVFDRDGNRVRADARSVVVES